jgi:uncharacterized circularly permuted ATP-grasp superfamily protein/uncharacterized alpha-E superfamily protein
VKVPQRENKTAAQPGPGFDGYQPLPGVPDEAVGPDGKLRPLWSRLSAHLAGLSPTDLAVSLARADQYLNDSGVFYRQYGGPEASSERQWPLSHVPVLLAQTDWDEMATALVQRADLLEQVMADLYGPNDLVAGGHLPAALVAGNPEWLRPMVGVAPRSGHHLHFLAFELGRGPDGKWWVLADRAQAPSGAGYALENRVATSRAFSGLYGAAHVHRLAGFFRDFRDALLAQRQGSDARVAILTPGPLNETYFEHAWIARYLGFTLVQGEDLVVEDGQLKVRTVAGPSPIEVLWRRLDASYADPMELDPASKLGTPGMVSALRAGGLSMVNALGSGVLETRALMAFLPQLSLHLTGEKLKMPNIATWWCGDPDAADEVRDNPGRLILSPALGTGTPFDATGQGRAADLSPDALAQWLRRSGPDLVAQEAVTLSTTPALVDGRLVPRPMTLRVFLARTAKGWQAMPGGFARIGARPDPQAVAMQHGGAAADVWVVSPGAVPRPSMAPAAGAPFRRATPGALPARAADNLFWLGRYVERTEGVLRLARACHMRLAEGGATSAPLLQAVEPLFALQGMTSGPAIPDGLQDTLSAAITSAGRVRDRFSPDAWSALADLDKSTRRMAARSQPGDDAARALSALLRKLAGISGLIHENMYRFMGWRFLTIGRLHERAMNMAAALAVLTDPQAPEGALDLAIEYGDSVMTHRRRFTVATSRVTVIDLLALDPLNPRSLRRQIDGLREEIDMLPEANDHGALSPLARAVLRLHADLATRDPSEMTSRRLWGLRGRIGQVSDQLTRDYFP